MPYVIAYYQANCTLHGYEGPKRVPLDQTADARLEAYDTAIDDREPHRYCKEVGTISGKRIAGGAWWLGKGPIVAVPAEYQREVVTLAASVTEVWE